MMKLVPPNPSRTLTQMNEKGGLCNWSKLNFFNDSKLLTHYKPEALVSSCNEGEKIESFLPLKVAFVIGPSVQLKVPNWLKKCEDALDFFARLNETPKGSWGFMRRCNGKHDKSRTNCQLFG